MKTTVFEFTDYRSYLKHALAEQIPPRGARSRLAQSLGCQTAFLSQVLAGKVHFSLEHAVKIGSFLGLDGDEDYFFILLVHLSRAGNPALRDHYQKQIDSVLEKRQLVEERIQTKTSLTLDDQLSYYSSWCFASLHVALSIPGLNNPPKLASRLGISTELAQSCLQFLTSAGLATRKGSEYEIGATRIHLGKTSPLVARHHSNWRIKAIQSLDSPRKDDLHYSGVFTLTRPDFKKVREMLLQALEKTEPVIRGSKEETIASLCLDWYLI